MHNGKKGDIMRKNSRGGEEMEELILTRPTLALEQAAADYRQEHLAAGETVLHGSALMDALP